MSNSTSIKNLGTTLQKLNIIQKSKTKNSINKMGKTQNLMRLQRKRQFDRTSPHFNLKQNTELEIDTDSLDNYLEN